MIPFNIPNVPEKSKQYVMQALESPHQQGDGPFTTKVSELISNLVGGGHVLLTPSCTHALEMASMLAEIGPGDEVILPSYTFTSAATAITKFGATPVFVDIEPESKGIAVDQVRHAITNKTKAISWVNYAGVAPDVDGLLGLAKDFDLLLIEDNAHGLGATHKGNPLGGFGDFSTQSFHATKNIQCGEGGALVVNNPKYIERAQVIREKGTNRSKFMRGEIQKYQWVDHGSSYLLAECLAALLLGQLEDFRAIQDKRQRVFDNYHTQLTEWALSRNYKLQFIEKEESHSAHMFYLVLDSKIARDQMIQRLKMSEIQAVFHYQSLASSIQGSKYPSSQKSFEVSEIMSNQLLRLPLHFALSEVNQNRIIQAITTSE